MEHTVHPDLSALLAEISTDLGSFEGAFPLEEFAAKDYRQHPFATLITCCDARVPTGIFGNTFNRVFCVENIGNQVLNSLGSVLYGVLHLHTPLLLVMGHTDCGAVKAASGDYSGEPDAIQKELVNVKSSLMAAQTRGVQIIADETPLKWGQLSEHNVDMQLERLLAVPQIKQLVDREELTILGLHLDLHDIYGAGHGKVWVVNINGEKSEDAMKQKSLPALASRIKRLL
ncbi:MAG: carbonic anhydrase [Syntrophomonadaceae bacterium]|nr:carbonic anhydrase [Syntrophomonadaceae bacterium]